ncbi:ParB/RepB/Spo0J family partition protein [Frigidibacter oleivorans]|uniref:ParB/RepB/Spo0J family partition protein n=1 Tax=Frigidibacter oleivorans TaxID=2487129 RepID=UPI000F8CF562|nr:ParB N-terminal domain-containing protein [Frigidibacter oleivorans]
MKTPILIQTSRVAVADVREISRLRPVSEAGVQSLIASIAETGVMKDAIHLRKKKDGTLVLIAGAHRLEAARRLGWEEIEAKVWADVTDDWARLMEIDDNLAGAEMNALDTAVFLARRKEVYERLHPETKHGGDRRSAVFQADTMSVRSFAAATAEKFNLTDRHVRRMIAAGSALTPHDVKRLRDAPGAVTLADLQVIGKAEYGERMDIVAALAEGRAKSAAAARKRLRVEAGVEAPVKDPVDTQFRALSDAWTRAGAAARKRFLFEFARDIWHAQNSGAALNNWSEAAEETAAAAEAVAAE